MIDLLLFFNKFILKYIAGSKIRLTLTIVDNRCYNRQGIQMFKQEWN